jgi:hypothetical protein
MQTTETAEIMRRFNQAFLEHKPAMLKDLIAPECVMESIQPAPDGTRYEGYDACFAFWEAIATDPVAYFDVKTRSRRATARPSAGVSISATVARCAAST